MVDHRPCGLVQDDDVVARGSGQDADAFLPRGPAIQHLRRNEGGMGGTELLRAVVIAGRRIRDDFGDAGMCAGQPQGPGHHLNPTDSPELLGLVMPRTRTRAARQQQEGHVLFPRSRLGRRVGFKGQCAVHVLQPQEESLVSVPHSLTTNKLRKIKGLRCFVSWSAKATSDPGARPRTTGRHSNRF